MLARNPNLRNNQINGKSSLEGTGISPLKNFKTLNRSENDITSLETFLFLDYQILTTSELTWKEIRKTSLLKPTPSRKNNENSPISNDIYYIGDRGKKDRKNESLKTKTLKDFLGTI